MEPEDIEAGDIVVVEFEDTFPMGRTAERRSVVEEVDGETVYLNVDGEVSIDRIVERIGKSPSVRDK